MWNGEILLADFKLEHGVGSQNFVCMTLILKCCYKWLVRGLLTNSPQTQTKVQTLFPDNVCSPEHEHFYLGFYTPFDAHPTNRAVNVSLQ